MAEQSRGTTDRVAREIASSGLIKYAEGWYRLPSIDTVRVKVSNDYPFQAPHVEYKIGSSDWYPYFFSEWAASMTMELVIMSVAADELVRNHQVTSWRCTER
jgi:hypothetical protein